MYSIYLPGQKILISGKNAFLALTEDHVRAQASEVWFRPISPSFFYLHPEQQIRAD